MGFEAFKKLELKVSINSLYKRTLWLLLVFLTLGAICYGFLIYQVKIINLEKTELNSVYQERELYLSKFYNNLNKNELILELFAVTNDDKYLVLGRENFQVMRQEFDSLYRFCIEDDDFRRMLNTSKQFMEMYITTLVPEYNRVLNELGSGKSGIVEFDQIKNGPGDIEIERISLRLSKKDEITRILEKNLDIIENKIIEPSQEIARVDRYAMKANKKLIETRINFYHIWQKIMVFLALGFTLVLLILLVIILKRPLEKPEPVYNSLPDHQYSAVFDGFESEITDLLLANKKLFRKYTQIILIFPRGSFFPIEIISAFQNFCQDIQITFQVKDRLQTSILDENVAFVILEDEALTTLVEAISNQNLVLGEQVGILGYDDNPLKRIIADGISVINPMYKDCDPSGFRSLKPVNGKCLSFVQRNSL